MDKGDKLLTAFQKEFGIEYAKNGFVNLPAMIKDTNIVSMIDELETNASYTSYYSLPQINAKGHSLITSLFKYHRRKCKKILRDRLTNFLGRN